MIPRLYPNRPLPPASSASVTGVVAFGNDLRVERLYEAYSNGIFPWPDDDGPIPWVSPRWRMLLLPGEIRVPRSLRKVLRNRGFSVTADRAFSEVVEGCSQAVRPDQDSTWISKEMKTAYCGAHEAGFAHSMETWLDGELVGGLYGISIGAMFCGESMFFRVPDASKVAFVTLYRQMMRWQFRFIDCQVYTPHTSSLGARTLPRAEYLTILSDAVAAPGRLGPWTLDVDPSDTSDLPPLS